MSNKPANELRGSGGGRSGGRRAALRDYLDGYVQSFDFYPVCTRHVFARNDAYALVVDFETIAEDLSFANDMSVGYPEFDFTLGRASYGTESRNKPATKEDDSSHFPEGEKQRQGNLGVSRTLAHTYSRRAGTIEKR